MSYQTYFLDNNPALLAAHDDDGLELKRYELRDDTDIISGGDADGGNENNNKITTESSFNLPRRIKLADGSVKEIEGTINALESSGAKIYASVSFESGDNAIIEIDSLEDAEESDGRIILDDVIADDMAISENSLFYLNRSAREIYTVDFKSDVPSVQSTFTIPTRIIEPFGLGADNAYVYYQDDGYDRAHANWGDANNHFIARAKVRGPSGNGIRCIFQSGTTGTTTARVTVNNNVRTIQITLATGATVRISAIQSAITADADANALIEVTDFSTGASGITPLNTAYLVNSQNNLNRPATTGGDTTQNKFWDTTHDNGGILSTDPTDTADITPSGNIEFDRVTSITVHDEKVYLAFGNNEIQQWTVNGDTGKLVSKVDVVPSNNDNSFTHIAFADTNVLHVNGEQITSIYQAHNTGSRGVLRIYDGHSTDHPLLFVGEVNVNNRVVPSWPILHLPISGGLLYYTLHDDHSADPSDDTPYSGPTFMVTVFKQPSPA